MRRPLTAIVASCIVALGCSEARVIEKGIPLPEIGVEPVNDEPLFLPDLEIYRVGHQLLMLREGSTNYDTLAMLYDTDEDGKTDMVAFYPIDAIEGSRVFVTGVPGALVVDEYRTGRWNAMYKAGEDGLMHRVLNAHEMLPEQEQKLYITALSSISDL